MAPTLGRAANTGRLKANSDDNIPFIVEPWSHLTAKKEDLNCPNDWQDEMDRIRLAGLLGVTHLLACSTAFAQPAPVQNYQTVEVMSGKSLRIGVHGSINKKDCSALDAPTIHLVKPPSSGSLSVQKRSVVADKIEGCTSVNAPIQLLVYTAGASGNADHDQIVYEVTSVDGTVTRYQVLIRITHASTSPDKKT